MLLHEKQAVYWRLEYPEVEETIEEPGLTNADFSLGPFDSEHLSSHPPESDWSDWFPPPPRLTDEELWELTDWVELEAEKHDLDPDTNTYPLEDYFLYKETYETQNDPDKYSGPACADSGTGCGIP